MPALLYHMSLVTTDVARAAAFYDRVLEPFGVRRIWDTPLIVGYGAGDGEEADFYIQSPDHMPFLEAPTTGAHFAFKAETPEQVTAFYEAALAAGAETVLAAKIHDDIHPTYFGTVIRDLDGHLPECFVIVDPAPEA
jgi:catechol 2,3-dioxygenase-like lactoylglutathione lyase family enzyme